MKILCATDFSQVSYNAIRYAYAFARQHAGSTIEITHCVDWKRRSDIFTKLDDILFDHAKDDMRILKRVLNPNGDDLRIDTTVFIGQPRTFLAKRARAVGAVLIVVGTTGLTAIKEMLLGSVTDYVARHTDIPLVAIPEDCIYSMPKRVLIGLGGQSIKHPERLSFLNSFFGHGKPKIDWVHVVEGAKAVADVESDWIENFTDFRVEIKHLQMNKSISQTLNIYAEEISADVICLIHQPRGWLGRLFQPSTMKNELYGLSRPLLIIPDLPAPKVREIFINDED